MSSPSYEVLVYGREVDHAFLGEANARVVSVAARLPHNLGHRMRVLVADRLKPGDDTCAVGGITVLARLPFAPDVEDLDLDADDRPALHSDEIRRRVADRPGRFAPLVRP